VVRWDTYWNTAKKTTGSALLDQEPPIEGRASRRIRRRIKGETSLVINLNILLN